MGFRISFTLVLTVLTLVLSLAPAVIIWVLFMDLMTFSVDLLKGTTHDSTDSLAEQMQEMLMFEAMEKLDARLSEGANELLVQQAMVKASGLLRYELRPSRLDIQSQVLTPLFSRNFVALKGHSCFSEINTVGVIYRNGTDTVARRTFWISWIALLVDLKEKTIGNRTLYTSTLAMSPNEQTATMNDYYVDQFTAAPLKVLRNLTEPSMSLTMPFIPSGWDSTLSFNPFTGQVQLTAWHWQAAQNDTWIQVSVSISAETISEELKAQLSDTPNDRLVLFFRQPGGCMIAASHGKYWSQSDVDLRYVDPIANPPDTNTFELWTCLQSNDALIQQACQQLYDTYQSWTAIPELRQETVLRGERYWLATEYCTGNLRCTVLMLKNRASVMETIDEGNAQVDQSVSDRKAITFIILGVISAIAVFLPLTAGLWLASRLYSLAAGMERIAKLQFTAKSTQPTVFQELHRFQASFVQMERGLQAFGKFVPQAVVKVLIAGQMETDNEMLPEMLTIMFADIEGFSTICENASPQELVTVCTEYFEAMCSNIVEHNGTIDKFIGDCIMAMWNAPERLPGHERDAVAAALAMQDSVMEMHGSWQRRGLPPLKFRLGIHTGTCLVGNFGCTYRVSYTCLGDGVNLSARLEALNKKFGTNICVSHATYEACRSDFHFRRLARVTVPGKAEVVPVYEVLCEADDTLRPKDRRPLSTDPPGAVGHPEDGGEMLSVHQHVGYSLATPLVFRPESAPRFDPPNTGQVPCHWMYVDRTALLQQADQYEQAYDALVAGDQAQARQLLMAQPLLDITDKAWTTLVGQLENLDASRRWDGVFHFREK